MKSGVVSVAYARIVHLGAGGVGKSSFQRGMMNKPLPDEANVNSTQMADLSTFQPGQSGASRDVSTHTAKGGSVSGGYWVPVTEDDETNELVGLVRLVYDVSSGETESLRVVKLIQVGITLAASRLSRTRSSPEISEAQKIIEEIIEIAKQHPEIQAPESEVFLYVWDCGGQQVFLCILPVFLTSKSMFFLMFDASKDLHKPCLSLSHHQGHATEQVLEQSTIELLLQWMSCIDATLTDKSAYESITKMPEYPRILPVGTHGDDPTVQANKERILEQLYTEYKDKEYAHLVCDKGVIIDNTTAGQENADPGYRRVLQIVNDFACSSEMKVDTPLTWVLFRKVLRRMAKNKPYFTLKEVVAVAEACTIPRDSVPSVLKFYHDLAVFLHYDKIPSLSSIVIADPQWLIKQIAKLLALEGFEKVRAPRLWDILRNHGILVEALYAEIWKTSTEDELNPCLPPQSIVDLLEHFLLVAPVNTRGKVHNLKGKEYFVPSVLPPLPTTPQAPQQEKSLSSSTRNNAPSDPPSHERRPSTPNDTPPSHERRPSTPYYKPPDSPSHVRNPSTQNDGPSNPPLHKGLSDPPSYDRRAAPLHLVFPDIKYLPPGFFTRLATALPKKKAYDIAFGHGIYRNRVSFTLGQSGSKIDTLTISECKHSIQIDLVREKPRESGNPIFPDICQEVIVTIQKGLTDQISQWFPGIKMAFAFSCDHCKTNNPHTPEHFVLLESEYTTKSCLLCQEDKIYEQKKDQKKWLKIAKVCIS